MTEFDEDLIFCEDPKRPSKGAERRQAIQDDLDDLMDLYPEYEAVMSELRF
ncbi:hypothetical protein ACIPJG_32105 [Streptomyces halstedii]|uniref:hypothetical protein n=1 Tax=Streptomyces halstedii TaxID=1944 RepID=UPI00381FC766